MIDFENETTFYVFCNFPSRGWRLAHGNLRDEAEALRVEQSFTDRGLPTRVTRRSVEVISS